MNKKGKVSQTVVISGIFAVVLLLVVAMFTVGGGFNISESKTGGTGGTGASCPDSLTTAGTVTVYNKFNTSAVETRDQTLRIYELSNGNEVYKTQITDTTAGAVTLDCGKTYRARLLSSNADGEGAKIVSVSGGEVGSNGEYVEFSTSGATATLDIYSKSLAGVKARAYDNNEQAYVYDASDATNNDYETTGATFKSVTDNATATAVGTGDNVDFTFHLLSNAQYADVVDFGAYILVDAPVTDYDVDAATVSFNGKSLTAETLSGKEATAYNDYEKVYKISATDAKELIANSGTPSELRLNINALADVDANDDIVIAIAPIGSVQETNGLGMRYSSVTDASSPSAIYTLQSYTIDIS
jgi:hypothetical protein